MKKKLKIFSAAIACVLIAAFAVNQFFDIITYAVEDNTYLESVEIFNAPTKEEAKQKCINAGYYASDADMNSGNSGGAVIIGFKTTKDPNEAITDMSVLEMNTGYEISDYSDIRESAMEKAGLVTSEFMKAVSEYRDNLEKGSPDAIKAQKVLNIYTIDEMDGIGLGDYLAGNKCTEDFLKKIICQANAGVIYAIFNSMSSGVADYGGENWAERLGGDTEVKKQLADGSSNTLLDNSYKKYAYELVDQLQLFYENYQKAKNYTDANGMESLEEGVEKAKECDISDETVEKLEKGEKFDEKDGYFIYLEAYEILGQYKYDGNTTVADYIKNLGAAEYKTDADLRKIYPLADALTQGQISVFRVSGVVQMALSLVNDSKILDITNDSIKEIYDLLRDAYDGKKEHLSIWVNTDQTQYNAKIAKTDANIISTRSGMEFDNLTKESGFEKDIDKAIALTYVICSAIDIATVLTTIGAEIAVIHKVGATAWWVGESVKAWAVCTNAIAFSSGTIFSSILGILGCTFIVLGYVAFAAIICIALFQLGKYIYDQFADEKDSLDYTLNDIPRDVYDYRNQSYLHYKAVQLNKSGKPADLNAENGRRFAALYYTKDENAGDPITVNPDGNEFMVASGGITAPDGYEGVRYFGPGAVANLNSYANNKSAVPLFLFYYKYMPTPINEGEESESADSSKEKPLYLESLSVSVQKTEAAAKDELKKQGYIPLDINLSGYYGKENGTYTYLGYKTTTLEKEAVRDIRVVPQNLSTGSSFFFGNIPYSRAGGDSIPGTVPSVYFTKSAEAGTPVYSDLQVTNDRKNAKEGFEPVNLFCGGDAYNLNATDGFESDPLSLQYSNWYGSRNVYIYFHPSVTYTSGQKYIGGLAFFTGKNTSAVSGDEISAYAEENGFKTFGENFTEDYTLVFNQKRRMGKGHVTTEEAVSDIVTYLAYSETYNPYRAIYGIKSYTAMSPDMISLNEMMITGATKDSKESYAACNVFYQFGNDISADDEKIRSFSRGIVPSNAWNGLNEQAVEAMHLSEIETYPEQEKDDFENCSWKTSAPRLKNLYVCGNTPGKAPLTVDGIKIAADLKKESEYNDDGLYSVQDVKTPNREQAHNIGISSGNPVYLFFKQNKPSEGRYISSISLASWNFDSYISNDKSYSKMSDDEKEEIREMYENIKEDLCISTALQSAKDELVMKNLAVSYDDSRQASPENVPKQIAYIAVTRTDNSAEAIHSVIKFKYNKKSDAELKIKVGGTEYIRIGDEPVCDEQFGNYFLYASMSGGTPGEPLTSISFDGVPLVKDCATALTAVETDTVEYVKGKEVTKTRAELKGYKGETNYIHCGYETERTYLCDIFIGSGNSREEAMLDLMNMGCNMFLDIDMNKNAGGKYIFVGYDRSDSSDTAIRDILCTVGKKAEAEIEVNGVTYQRARDRYIMNYDSSKSVSFNEGTNGYSIYLYYSYETERSPIMNLAASERDYTPDNKGGIVWENILTDNIRRCNFNDGVYASDDGHSIDNRVYMFANRQNNSVRNGARISGRDHSDTMKYGKLVLKAS